MDQNSYAVYESTALASSRQQTVGARGTSGVPSWSQSGCDIFELFEVYRRSANRYLNQCFECLDRLPASSTELNAYSRSQVSTREGSEAERNVWLLKISHDSAVRDLTVLDEILDKAKEQEKPPERTVSPSIAAWTFACSILAFAVPHKISSAIFKVGALAGALLFTFGLLRKPPRVSRLGPVQHKIQGLIRSFKDDAAPGSG
ncbi:hypothetical protein FALBO_13587 [Fusarium albosuccineum]|uniref:Uncharacterized protein n=1 Tax=Fusarium albosuccineum TaxID=1237068 RepID=A0A8H4L1R4_9HYPO|nr:hypothetical protein FALBO_13587 [Fusarium albosuccineum]